MAPIPSHNHRRYPFLISEEISSDSSSEKLSEPSASVKQPASRQKSRPRVILSPDLSGRRIPAVCLKGQPANVARELRRSFVVPMRSGLLRMTRRGYAQRLRNSNFRVRVQRLTAGSRMREASGKKKLGNLRFRSGEQGLAIRIDLNGDLGHFGNLFIADRYFQHEASMCG